MSPELLVSDSGKAGFYCNTTGAACGQGMDGEEAEVLDFVLESHGKDARVLGTEPRNNDEGSVTVTQLQALRACRNVGIKVPREVIAKAVKYLKDCQNADGGISYSYSSRGSSRPAIAAAAIACFYAAGIYDRQSGGKGPEAEMVDKLIKYVLRNVKVGGGGRFSGHYFYTHFYMAQALYQRGGKDWKDYYPKIKKDMFSRQNSDGSWQGDGVGTTYGTAIATIILQLPYGYLPIFQR